MPIQNIMIGMIIFVILLVVIYGLYKLVRPKTIIQETKDLDFDKEETKSKVSRDLKDQN